MMNWIVDRGSSVEDDLFFVVHAINDNNKQKVIRITANLGLIMSHLPGSLRIDLIFITIKYIKGLLNRQSKVLAIKTHLHHYRSVTHCLIDILPPRGYT
jgi:hypothetical protein